MNYEELERLNNLKAQGLISEEDFQKEKERLSSQDVNPINITPNHYNTVTSTTTDEFSVNQSNYNTENQYNYSNYNNEPSPINNATVFSSDATLYGNTTNQESTNTQYNMNAQIPNPTNNQYYTDTQNTNSTNTQYYANTQNTNTTNNQYYANTQNAQTQSNPNNQTYYSQPNNPVNNTASKSKLAAGLLGILLGSLGVHNFYLGYNNKAIAQLLITVLSCGALSVISSIWGIVEGIKILTGEINTDANGVPLSD